MGAKLSKILGQEKKSSWTTVQDTQEQQCTSAIEPAPSVYVTAASTSTKRRDSESTTFSRCPLKKVFRLSAGSKSDTPSTVVESEGEERQEAADGKSDGSGENSNGNDAETAKLHALYNYSASQETGKLITAAATRLSEEIDRKKRAAAAYQRKYCLTPCPMEQSSNECMPDSNETEGYSSPSIAPNTTLSTAQSQNSRAASCVECRKKVTIEEVLKNLYYHPASEEERRKEKDRQQRMHYLLKRIWNGIFRVELHNPQLIIHWRCGMGVWGVEMATRFPNAKVIGIDFKEAMPSHLQSNLHNLEFVSAVVTDKCSGFQSIEDGSVDFVLMRDTWLTNSPSWKWDNVLAEVYRVLKPGGSVEIEEHVVEANSTGTHTKQLLDWYDTFFEALNANRRTVAELDPFIVRAGFISLTREEATIPLGEWPESAPLKEIGYLFKDLLERRCRGMARWVAEACNIDESHLHEIITKVMEDEADSNRAYIEWVSYTAQKPQVDF